MATRRTKPTDLDETAVAPLEPTDVADDPVILTAADRLALAIEASAEDQKAEVRIYKLGTDERFTWCETMPPDAYERGGYGMLRANWGHGTFKVVLYGTTDGKAGKPGFGIRAEERVSIAEDRLATAAAASNSGELQRALDAMAAVQQQQQQLVAALAQRSTGPDLMSLLKDVVPLLPALKDIFGGKRETVMDALKMLRELKSTGSDLFGDAPAAEPSDPLTAALPQLLELVKTAGQQTPPATGLVAPVTLPASVAEPGAAGTDHPTQENPAMPQIDNAQQLLAELSQKFDVVVGLAGLGMDPEQGALVIYEHLPDEMFPLLEQANWFEVLCQFAPQAKPHRDWLDKARVLVLQWLNEGDDDGADDAAPGTPVPPVPPVPPAPRPGGAAEAPAPKAKRAKVA